MYFEIMTEQIIHGYCSSVLVQNSCLGVSLSVYVRYWLVPVEVVQFQVIAKGLHNRVGLDLLPGKWESGLFVDNVSIALLIENTARIILVTLLLH